jgi:hypothetical protein
MKRLSIALFVVLGVAFGVGCNRSESNPVAPQESTASAESPELVARVHWLGKQRLGAEANAASLMGIWNLAESAELEAQVLDKFSLSPWRLLKGDAATNGAPVSLLRPLLDDLVQEEFYLEVRNPTNQFGEFAFALRLSADRAAMWQTNLSVVFESLTGVRASKANGGWSLQKHETPIFVELVRVSEWVIVCLSQKSNTLASEFTSRIRHHGTPLATPKSKLSTDHWLAMELDPSRLSQALALDWQSSADISRISFSVTGDGANVHTQGELEFSKPLGVDLEAWNVPTNLVRDPLISFTAVRGLKSWLPSSKAWSEFFDGVRPNQVFLWSQHGIPIQTYFAAPSVIARDQVGEVTGRLLQVCNPWLATNGMGQIVMRPGTDGASWTGAPFMSPFLQAISLPGGEFIFCGLVPLGGTNRQPPAELLAQFSGRTNVMLYDWELTGPKIGSLLFVGQAFRVILQRPQLPFDSASLSWLKSAGSKLGNSGTVVSLTSPTNLSFTRKSSIGLTAVELHALADWLESPVFPRGLHTLDAPPPPRVPADSKVQNAAPRP